MRSAALALIIAAVLGTPAAQPAQVNGRSQPLEKSAPGPRVSGPVDENNVARGAAARAYNGRVDERNSPLDPWPGAPPALEPGTPDRREPSARQEALATELLVFPAAGDTRFTQAGADFWVLGDFVEGVRNFANPANQVEMTLSISSNGLTCDTQDHALKIDGVTVGLFSVSPGEAVVVRTFLFPTVAPGAHTIRIETVRTLASGCGCAGFPDDVSTLSLENTTGKFTFPATGDTRSILLGTSFWNQGDFVEGVRNFTELTDEIEMMLTISPNGLSCDTQDHALLIDGATVGTFSVGSGETQVIQRFLFPAVTPGPHTIRIETTRTVTGGCGSAGFPDDVSMLSLFYVPGDKFGFPATGDASFFLVDPGFPWNLGDFFEGVRTFTESTGEVDMMLVVGLNVLGCDTQDHALLIDGNVIGNFVINPGDAQVSRNFTFPTITAGQHTIRLETTRTVNGGCGAAEVPIDVSMLRFLPSVIELGSVPPTISVERLGAGQLRIRWQAGLCDGADDYGIYEGTLGSWYSHTAMAGQCSDPSPFFEADVVAAPGDTYYLVVPNTTNDEGSYGIDTAGFERPVGLATCAPGQLLGCSVLAADDNYECVGNVGITVPAAAGLLANDALGTIVTAVSASVNGGLVAAAVDGSFTYDPPPGFNGVDSFTYDVDDGSSTDSATAFITVGTSIWFLDNTGVGSNFGTLSDPFLSLGSFEAVNGNGGGVDPEAGDCIFLYTGTGTYTNGVTLEIGQDLIGQGAGGPLDNLCGIVLPPHSNSLPPTGGARPTLVSPIGNGITLAQNHTIRGLNVGDTLGIGIAGVAGTLTVGEMLITGQGAALGITNGTLNASFDSILVAGTSFGLPGVSLQLVSGDLTVAGGTTMGGGIGGNGIDIQDSPNSVFNFGPTAIEKSLTAGFGVHLDSNQNALVTFDELSIVTGSGTGLSAGDSGSIVLFGGPSSINATGGAAVDVNQTQINMTFSTLTSDGGAVGILLSDTPGTFQVTGGTGIDAAAATAISIVNNGSLDVDFSTIDVNGAGGSGILISGPVLDFDVSGSTQIEGAAGFGLTVVGAAGGSFDFGATDIGQLTPVGTGVDLGSGNAGATFNFASLNVTTFAGYGLLANNSGTVNIAGVPSLQATGGAAVDITNTIGNVAGTGTWTFSSLTSQSSTSHGIRFADLSQDVDLSDISVVDPVTSGILLSNISATASLVRGSITFPGVSNDGDGIRADQVVSLMIQGDPGDPFVIDGAGAGGGINAGHGIHASFCDTVSIARLDIDNISDPGGAVLESGVYLEDTSVSVSVTDSTIHHVISGDAIFVENCNNAVAPCAGSPRSLAGSLSVDINNNTLAGIGLDLTATTANGVRIEYETANGGRVLASIGGNVIDNLNEGIGIKLRGNGGTGPGGAHRVRIGGGELNLGPGQADPDANPNLITDFRNDGMDLSFEDTTLSKWFIRNNTVDAFVNHTGVKGTDVARDLGISWEVGGTVTGTSGTADLFLINNIVRDNLDEGIRVRGFGDPITATVNMLLQDNDVQDNGDEFRVEVGDAGTFNVTVVNNHAVNNDAGGADFLFGHRNIITGAPILRVALFNNTADGYQFERTASGAHEIGCSLAGSPSCPLGATTLAATLVTVLDKMGNVSGFGLPAVVTTGASGSFIIVDAAGIPGPTP